MKKIFSLLLLLLCTFVVAKAQVPNIIMKTDQPISGTVTLRIVAGGNVTIDWGTGQKEAIEASKNFGAPSTHEYMLITNSLEIKIYGYNITFLQCSNNSLISLDVTNAPHLRTLQCNNNKLTELDVTKNEQLRILWTGSNPITNLDLSQNEELTQLSCISNKLMSLDLSYNTKLLTLVCAINNLGSLDLSKNTLVRALDLRNTNLTSLDLSNNPNVTTISIHNDGPTYANQFDACALDKLFGTLPIASGTINILNSKYTGKRNNNAVGSNKTIASNKGWIVNDKNNNKELIGDGKECK